MGDQSSKRRGRRVWPFAWLYPWVLAVLCCLPVAAVAQAPCLKLVFNRYCLGGDVNALAQQLPPVLRDDEGHRVALIYYEGRDRIYVLAWRGRIYKVLRRYPVASKLRYEELYLILREKYGDGEDRSRFPADATTAGRKQIAIRRGEGVAAHVWQASEDWHLELSWTRELGLALAYIADELDRAQSAAMQSGY
ncbi:MAG: hypothetical protein PVH47_02380 [Thiohalocapsa sp.]|jgi:hypothetical protein